MSALFPVAMAFCDRPRTITQKTKLTLLALVWVINPLDFDFIPILGWIDEGFVAYCVARIWQSPTIPPTVPPIASTAVTTGISGSQRCQDINQLDPIRSNCRVITDEGRLP